MKISAKKLQKAIDSHREHHHAEYVTQNAAKRAALFYEKLNEAEREVFGIWVKQFSITHAGDLFEVDNLIEEYKSKSFSNVNIKTEAKRCGKLVKERLSPRHIPTCVREEGHEGTCHDNYGNVKDNRIIWPVGGNKNTEKN